MPLGANPFTNPPTPTIPAGATVNFGQGPINVKQGGTLDFVKNTAGSDAAYSRIIGDYKPAPVTPSPAYNNEMTNAGKMISELQGQAAGVNKIYDTKIADYRSGAGNSNAGATRARDALLGIAGSTSAESRQENTNAINQKNQDAINAQRAARLNGIYNEMNKVQAGIEKATASNDEATKQAQLKDAETQGTNILQGISKALGNVSFDQFKENDPQSYANLRNWLAGNGIGGFNSATMSPDQERTVDDKMRLAWNAALGPGKVQYDTTSVPGYALYTDPKTGQIHSLKMKVPPGWQLTIAGDGTPLTHNPATNETKIAPGFEKGAFAKPNALKANIRSVQGGIYDVDNQKWILQPKPKSSTTSKTKTGWDKATTDQQLSAYNYISSNTHSTTEDLKQLQNDPAFFYWALNKAAEAKTYTSPRLTPQ